MVAVPNHTGVTFPLLFTFTTFLFDDDHLTFLFVFKTPSCSVSAIDILILVLFNLGFLLGEATS